MQSERWIVIMDIIREEKSARVEDLALRLNVSENTIRRDLSMLSRRGLIERTKGGALSNMEGLSEKSFSTRQARNRSGKELIAEKAASLVRRGETIILDGGTTALLLAEKIAEMDHITVLTNSLDVAQILSENSNITLVLSGGIFDPNSRTMTGPPAQKFFEEVNGDKLFLAVTGISAEKGLTDQNMQETPVKIRMLASAAEVIVLADSSKFGRTAFSPICDLSQIDRIITDTLPDRKTVEDINNKNVEIITCTEN